MYGTDIALTIRCCVLEKAFDFNISFPPYLLIVGFAMKFGLFVLSLGLSLIHILGMTPIKSLLMPLMLE